MHIPRTGGTAVEKSLGLGPLGHERMSSRKKNLKASQFFTVLRDPLEAALSTYFFEMNDQSSVRLGSVYERQAALCKAGTGLKYGNKCEAKVAPYDFVLKNCKST